MILPQGQKSTKKILPVIFIIDISWTMRENAKIDSVNNAMLEAIEELSDRMANDIDTVVELNVLKFGCKEGDLCQWMYDEMISINAFTWIKLKAEGRTPLGEAYIELDKKLSRNEYIKPTSLTYAPVLILITDGMPNNRKSACEGLNKLKTNEWFNNSERMAIGVDLHEKDDTSFLYDFVEGSENGEVFFEASDVSTLMKITIKKIVIDSVLFGATRLINKNTNSNSVNNSMQSPDN